jgi:hypothetical protein
LNKKLLIALGWQINSWERIWKFKFVCFLLYFKNLICIDLNFDVGWTRIGLTTWLRANEGDYCFSNTGCYSHWCWCPTRLLGHQHRCRTSVYTPHRCPFFIPLTFSLLLQHKVLYHQNSHLPRSHCESIHQGILIHSLPFIWKCTINWALFFNEFPLLWLKLFIFWNVHFFISDLDRMTLLGNVHILCIIA